MKNELGNKPLVANLVVPLIYDKISSCISGLSLKNVVCVICVSTYLLQNCNSGICDCALRCNNLPAQFGFTSQLENLIVQFAVVLFNYKFLVAKFVIVLIYFKKSFVEFALRLVHCFLSAQL